MTLNHLLRRYKRLNQAPDDLSPTAAGSAEPVTETTEVSTAPEVTVSVTAAEPSPAIIEVSPSEIAEVKETARVAAGDASFAAETVIENAAEITEVKEWQTKTDQTIAELSTALHSLTTQTSLMAETMATFLSAMATEPPETPAIPSQPSPESAGVDGPEKMAVPEAAAEPTPEPNAQKDRNQEKVSAKKQRNWM